SRPAIFDHQVPAFNVALLFKPRRRPGQPGGRTLGLRQRPTGESAAKDKGRAKTSAAGRLAGRHVLAPATCSPVLSRELVIRRRSRAIPRTLGLRQVTIRRIEIDASESLRRGLTGATLPDVLELSTPGRGEVFQHVSLQFA